MQLLALKAQRQAGAAAGAQRPGNPGSVAVGSVPKGCSAEVRRSQSGLLEWLPPAPERAALCDELSEPASRSAQVLRAHFSVCGEVLRATVLKDKVTKEPRCGQSLSRLRTGGWGRSA